MIHVRRYFLALGVLLGVFCAYSLAVAPWIVPPKIARVAGQAAAAQPVVMELPPHLAALFPPEAWERRGEASGYTFTVKALAYITAGHVAHHLGLLAERYGFG